MWYVVQKDTLQFAISVDILNVIFKRWLRVGDLLSLLPLDLKWGSSNTDDLLDQLELL